MNFFVNKEQIEGDCIFIKDSDVNHIKNVLRKSEGDIIKIVSERNRYDAEIVELKSDSIKCKIINMEETEEDMFRLTIFQGLAKADKIEYIIQKCTELGVYEIIPVEMKRCVVKLDSKDKIKKIDRWQKIAEVASKQSLRDSILNVNSIMSFEEMCSKLSEFDCVILAYEKEEKTSLKDVLRDKINSFNNVAVIVGPEGGIDVEEERKLVQSGAISVTLGKRILRTETAPVVLSAIIMYEKEDK